MARAFETPPVYKSDLIETSKKQWAEKDRMKKDFSPGNFEYPRLSVLLARHFGFCFGVQNAVEIAYKALDEHPDKRIFLLSEMIHNPGVNNDLVSKGVRFLQTTSGKELIPLSDIVPDDIVILPAFGVSVEIEAQLRSLGIEPDRYDTTCPFVRRVWKRAADLGRKGFSIVIHGKPWHEETRATFSHAAVSAPSLVVLNRTETEELCMFIKGERPVEEFNSCFGDRVSEGFCPEEHLSKLGVVNQTTMLAEETAGVAQLVKAALEERYGSERISQHFADTRDTLCYATSENQRSVQQMMKEKADCAIVIGGFNSSNTCHLAKLCERSFPTYHIRSVDDMPSTDVITFRDVSTGEILTRTNWFPKPAFGDKVRVAITAGASTPDSAVESVIEKLASF